MCPTLVPLVLECLERVNAMWGLAGKEADGWGGGKRGMRKGEIGKSGRREEGLEKVSEKDFGMGKREFEIVVGIAVVVVGVAVVVVGIVVVVVGVVVVVVGIVVVVVGIVVVVVGIVVVVVGIVIVVHLHKRRPTTLPLLSHCLPVPRHSYSSVNTPSLPSAVRQLQRHYAEVVRQPHLLPPPANEN
ncbi:hypothetical protein Pmani_012876 [Petrolisthes manimaculis]|uniref:Uncharacterized protein n=1 Tax=Petrolisthes manimaculis TaxID=1843537 RepID=A0AAE1PW39_9EUCA|nr:hypothetical protein Pmani_012876 [Petrolisthes manimaculis]